ncbi:hypothetical protein BDV93DRAFT_524206 [Ceratobasidium sp. AG-I]|nr:hypothetical protein BDV93DRAFT_524206 [Ceratobasidium sp. AG-I]
MATQHVEALYNKIFQDPRVRKVLDKIAQYFPIERCITIAIGSAVASGLITFVVIPLIGFTPGGVAANSIAASIQSAVYGGNVTSGSIFAILQSLGATASALPALLVGTMTAAGVLAVKVLSDIKEVAEKANEEVQKVVEQDVKDTGATTPEDGEDLQEAGVTPQEGSESEAADVEGIDVQAVHEGEVVDGVEPSEKTEEERASQDQQDHPASESGSPSDSERSKASETKNAPSSNMPWVFLKSHAWVRNRSVKAKL